MNSFTMESDNSLPGFEVKTLSRCLENGPEKAIWREKTCKRSPPTVLHEHRQQGMFPQAFK
jgi:hypothetical protein